MEEEEVIKLRAGNYRYPVSTWLEGSDRFFRFAFNRPLMEEIKQMEGSKWHGYDDTPRKLWSVAETPANKFQLAYLKGENPYAPYDAELKIDQLPVTRFNHRDQKHYKLYAHQPSGVAHILQRHNCIIAGEMGTTKTLMAMMAMELASSDPQIKWWYVAPRSALAAVQREWKTWGGFVTPEWMTYEGLVKRMKNWVHGDRAPFGVIFDESSKLKNMTSQRSQAAKALADGVRADWGGRGYVVLMSGSPAPKSPVDWFSQASIACPGFLKEGDIHKFKRRLGIIIQKEGIDGGVYPQLVTWRDNPLKCNVCGKFGNEDVHRPETGIEPAEACHEFEPSKNEIALLYERLKGLVIVFFKKDCLDLPDKHYRTLEVQPNKATIRAMLLIKRSARSTIEGLTLLRELSDGFQYVQEATDTEVCKTCKGVRRIQQPQEIEGSCSNCQRIETPREGPFDVGHKMVCGNHQPQMKMVEASCPTCGGTGEVTTFTRTTQEVPCPKDEALVDLLDEHSDIGRIVIYGGFHGSIDRCVRLCLKEKWTVIRMDQGGVKIIAPNGSPIQEKDFLSLFQDRKEEYPKVAFVAHPGSAGMGLTLTASPTIVYFSNTFNAEERIQSEDRIHRPGMDLNLGATIIDIVHLPSDKKILENLQQKRDLQALTLGDFMDIMDRSTERPE